VGQWEEERNFNSKNMKTRNKRDKRDKYKEIDSDSSSGLDPDVR
jgi:hypothetical protein